MANLPKELLYLSSIHTSKGVYRQPKLDVNAFLESGENIAPLIKSNPTNNQKKTEPSLANPKSHTDDKNNAENNNQNACTRSNTPDFENKLKEALSFLKQGLPNGAVMKVMIPYAINIIKPAEGKENVWFECVSYDGNTLQVVLKHSPVEVKYLKQGSTIKPALEKIEMFSFEG